MTRREREQIREALVYLQSDDRFNDGLSILAKLVNPNWTDPLARDMPTVTWEQFASMHARDRKAAADTCRCVRKCAVFYMGEPGPVELCRSAKGIAAREAAAEAEAILGHIDRQSPPLWPTGALDGDPVIRVEWDESRPVAGEGNDGK